MHANLDYLAALVSGFTARSPVRSVAVVANAPLPPSAERAAIIDDSDLIFRINSFRTDIGGEPSVGERTDVVLLNRGVRGNPWFFSGYRRRLYLMVEPEALHGGRLDLPVHWPADLGAVSVPNEGVLSLACEALGYDLRAAARWPTTGTLAAWLAFAMFPCADIVLTGYSFLDNPSQTRWAHADGSSSPVTTEVHTLVDEASAMKRWAEEGRVRFV